MRAAYRWPIAGFTELLLNTDAGTAMVEDDQVWLVELIVGFDGVTHIGVHGSNWPG